MNIPKYIEEMRNIQMKLLNYLDDDDRCEENYQNLKDIINDIQIQNNPHKLKSVLYMVNKISKNYYRKPNFFSKIEQILLIFKNDIKKYFSNKEIFHIFKSYKRILLFLFEENILIMDKYIVKTIMKGKYAVTNYPGYFSAEVKNFINEKWFPKYDNINEFEEIPNDFSQKRKEGENDDIICKLIQKDSIEDFIIYVNKNSVSLKSTIKPSIYETNNFLLKKEEVSLIEYAVFFGSNQIFNYLRLNKVDLTPSLWIFAIHSNNAETISLLEENQGKPKDDLYNKCIKESIKCHHIDMTNFFQNNYDQNEKDNSDFIMINSLKYYNFCFEQNDFINESSFYYLCKYDYYIPVNFSLKEMKIDINRKAILLTNI